MNSKKVGLIAGIVLIFIVIAVGFFVKNNQTKEAEQAATDQVSGLIGGEKSGLFNSTEFNQFAREHFKLGIKHEKEGSIEMARRDISQLDYVFPSSQVAEQIFVAAHKDAIKKSETVFYSPIVIYSWDKVTDALEKEGIVNKKGDIYTLDTFKLIALIEEGKAWKDVGLSELYGNVNIVTTNPSKSNSGNMFAGLLANALNEGQVVTSQTLPTVLPKVKGFYDKLGYLEDSSGDLFEQYLNTGMGAKPMIVGYENQIIEFANENPAVWDQAKNKVKILYPVPTVWSAHPVIALSDEGRKVIDLLLDEKIQKMAWENHGLRSGLSGFENDPAQLNVQGIAKDITSVMQMPTADEMTKIVEALE